MHLGTFRGATGTIGRRTATTAAQAAVLRALGLGEPPQFSQLTPARSTA